MATQLDLCNLYGHACKLTCGLCNTSSCGLAPLNTESFEQIVSGKPAPRGFFPWQVGIYLNDKFHCGGALIGKQHILSAAHCFDSERENYKNMYIKVGDLDRDITEPGEQAFELASATIHPGYNKETGKNDIVIAKIKGEVGLNKEYVVPICLPEKNAIPDAGTRGLVSGWGKTYHYGKAVSMLQYINVPIVSEIECARVNDNYRPVTQTNICTGSADGSTFKSACQGDSGGPLAVKSCEGTWKLVGIVSWGHPQCDALFTYNVFTRVSSYIDWINENRKE